MDGAVKYTVPVVNHEIPSVVGLRVGEQIHVLDVGRYHHPPALTDWSHRSDPYLLAHFRTDDSLGMVLILRGVRVEYVGVKAMSEELLDHRDGAVSSVGRIPPICSFFRVALASLVWAREGPLVMLVDNICPFYHHAHCPKMNFIAVRHHVVQGMILFILHPFSLAGSL